MNFKKCLIKSKPNEHKIEDSRTFGTFFFKRKLYKPPVNYMVSHNFIHEFFFFFFFRVQQHYLGWRDSNLWLFSQKYITTELYSLWVIFFLSLLYYFLSLPSWNNSYPNFFPIKSNKYTILLNMPWLLLLLNFSIEFWFPLEWNKLRKKKIIDIKFYVKF